MAEFSDAKSGEYCMCTRERCSDECRTYRQFHPKPVTNADRIRALSDEELAKQIVDWNNGDCPHVENICRLLRPATCEPWKCWLDWLRQEALP